MTGHLPECEAAQRWTATGRQAADTGLSFAGSWVIRSEFLFGGMRLQRLAGTTVLTGQVTDQAHLLGLIEQIQELGIELVSVNPDHGTDGGAGPGAEPGWS